MLNNENCNLVGFADLRCLPNEARQDINGKIFDYGIIIALSFTKEAMVENIDNLPQKYFAEYEQTNKRLTELSKLTAQLLAEKGYETLLNSTSIYKDRSEWRTFLPHKTVATLAGVGWIGKCAMLVTNEVGAALRLDVILTNAPLNCGIPITKSFCPPNCTICVDICPNNAPTGGLWDVDVDRDEFFDVHACTKAALNRAKSLLDIEYPLCGLCMSSCPFTKKGLEYK